VSLPHRVVTPPSLSQDIAGSAGTPVGPGLCASGDLRCALSALPSPGSLVLVQTAQVVTETLVPARTIHPQVDRQCVVMLLCLHAIRSQEH
jgi:hypothetical protein